MKVITIAAVLSLLLLTVSCTTTTIKLSGTPASTFSGYYVLRGVTNTMGGSIPTSVKLPGVNVLQACEFQKARAQDSLILEIYHGRQQTLRAPASPGTLGVRAGGEGESNWHFELIR